VQLRQVAIERFRAIEALTLTPGPRNVLLGPQNAGKSSVLEALDLLLHHGIGRPRPAPTEIDYFGRDPTEGFVIEAVVGALDEPCSQRRTGSSRGGARRVQSLSASRKEKGSSR
jgi:recombinational DNA repair ATPase RecF